MGHLLFIGIALLALFAVFLLLRRLARQSRIKTTLYDHKSELEPTGVTYVMKPEEMKKVSTEIKSEDQSA